MTPLAYELLFLSCGVGSDSLGLLIPTTSPGGGLLMGLLSGTFFRYDSEMEWNASPELLSLGFLHLRWYGLLFALGFYLGFRLLVVIFRREGLPEGDASSVLSHTIIGTLIGARLGHCLFYEPEYYLSDPIKILKIWEGGLASHGATAGIILAIWLYSRKHPGQTILWVLDRLSVVVPVGAGMIRVGNFFNSEIIGKPTDLPWAIVFSRVDSIPRHPAQLYEAFWYFIVLGIMWKLYGIYKKATPRGFLFGSLITLIFGFRFFIEWVKEPQVGFEKTMLLNMGQILSIPFVAIGMGLVWRALNSQKKSR